MVFVLDASAMIAFLRDEPGASAVADALVDPNSRCYAHAINLCEVYYDFHRAAGREAAEGAILDLTHLGVIEDASLGGTVWRSVGTLKANLRRVSLADCFAIELTQRMNASLLTADHHEFDPLVGLSLCAIQFVR